MGLIGQAAYATPVLLGRTDNAKRVGIGSGSAGENVLAGGIFDGGTGRWEKRVDYLRAPRGEVATAELA